MATARATRRRARSWAAATTGLALAALGASGASLATASAAASSANVLVMTSVRSSGDVYVLTATTCAHAPCLALLVTSDVGASFTRRSLPPIEAVKGSPAGSFVSMDFATPSRGYLLESAGATSSVYATTDAARTWSRVISTSTDQLGDLTATATSLYVVAFRCAKQANGNVGCTHYRLLRRDVASGLWASTPVPNGLSFPWGFLGNVAAAGPDVWLTEGAKWSLLLSSHDAGASFTTRPVRALLSVAGCSLYAMSTRDLWSLCPTGMQASFAHSSDGGLTWTTVSTGGWFQTGGGAFDPVTGDLAVLDYGDRPGRYNIDAITGDGQVTGVGHSPCASVGQLVFTSARNGLATCGYGPVRLEHTSDAGATWRVVAVP